MYTMTTGTYIFYSIIPFAFMTKNKPVMYISNPVGNITGTAPNNDIYTFYTSNSITNLSTYHAIFVTVTGNFGYLSICTLSGYQGGQNLISFV